MFFVMGLQGQQLQTVLALVLWKQCSLASFDNIPMTIWRV